MTDLLSTTSFTGDGVSNWDTQVVIICQEILRNLVHGRCNSIMDVGRYCRIWDTSSVTFCTEHSTVRPRSREMDCQIGIRRG